MAKKVSRRDFAKSSVVAGAAVALPRGLMSEPASRKSSNGQKAQSKASLAGSAARGAVAADVTTWREGFTIPAEYYIDEKRYAEDERYVADHFWLLADHESRIPNAGDYFVLMPKLSGSSVRRRATAGAAGSTASPHCGTS